jgi:hypothetical protein
MPTGNIEKSSVENISGNSLNTLEMSVDQQTEYDQGDYEPTDSDISLIKIEAETAKRDAEEFNLSEEIQGINALERVYEMAQDPRKLLTRLDQVNFLEQRIRGTAV